MTARTPVWKFVLGFVIITIGLAISVPLGRYAERDDAPGGVVIAGAIMLGAVALAVWTVNRRPKSANRQ
jgi:uncharacterized membrane protein